MAGITDKGFVTQTFETIRDRIVAKAISPEYFGANFPVSPDSPFGNWAAISALTLKEEGWDLAQSVYDSFQLRSATGKDLDDIAAYIQLERLQAVGSSGDLIFTGLNNSTIPRNTAVKDIENRSVLTQASMTYDKTSCYQTTITVLTLKNNQDYVISVNGQTYTITSDNDATEAEIISSLQSAINIQPNYSATLKTTNELLVTYNSLNNSLSVATSNNLQVISVGALVYSEAQEFGALTFLPSTLTTLSSPLVGTLSVTNLLSFQQGRLKEDDKDFRLRIAKQKSSVGTATKPAIESSVRNIEGVVSTFVKENDTLVTDIDGQPAKSIQVFVEGGNEDAIAKVIWDTKPAAIPTYGSVQKIITDDNGKPQVVFLSRPSIKYGWVKVVYTLYTEEDFPTKGEQEIKQACVDYGNGLVVGEDVIPKRFEGKVYGSVTGLDDVTVTIALTDTLTPPLPIEYKSTRISVDTTTDVIFSLDRVGVTL